MESHLQSGYYYPNKAARAMLELHESVLGRNGLHALLNLAQLPDLKDNFPPCNMGRQFDFANFSLISQALEEIYGRRGGHALAVRAGRGVFSSVLSNYGALAGVRDPAFQALPLDARLKIGLAAIARILFQISDQQNTLEVGENGFTFTVQRCPHCWGRSGLDHAVCSLGLGVLQEGLKWLSGGREFAVVETKCKAKGDADCEYAIPKEPLA